MKPQMYPLFSQEICTSRSLPVEADPLAQKVQGSSDCDADRETDCEWLREGLPE